MKMLILLLGALFCAPAFADKPADPGGKSGKVPAPTQSAAAATANSTTNACAALPEFYWEIGNASGRLASGVKGASYSAGTKLEIASASKWIYGAYAAQVKVLDETDRKYLRMSAGYDSFTICGPARTVAECAARGTNGDYTAAEDGFFYYGGGHFEQHAVSIGLGQKTEATLGAEVSMVLGVPVSYTSPMLAGTAVMSASDYAQFLRKLMTGSLTLGPLLGTGAVCTNPATCPTAINSPQQPEGEDWMYSIGHWVEIDGSFSSAGAYGFYPWITADRQLYGILSRQDAPGSGLDSVLCGRLIRRAWLTGAVQ